MTPDMLVKIRASNDTGPAFNQVVGDAKRMQGTLTTGGKGASDAMKGVGTQTANVAAQFQDISVMLASGQNPLILALQQGTQLSTALGMAGGGVGGAVKTLGAGIMSLLSPLSLLTIGTIAVGAAAIQWLMGVNSGSKDAETALEDQEKALRKLLVGYDAAGEAADRAFKRAQTLPSGVVLSDLGASLIEQAEAADKVRDEIGRLREEYRQLAEIQERVNTQSNPAIDDNLGGSPADLAQASEYARLLDQLAISAGSSRHELQDAAVAARELFNEAEDPALRQAASDAYDLAQNLLSIEDHAYAAAAAIAAIHNADLLAGVAADAERVAAALADIDNRRPELRTEREIVGDDLRVGLGSEDAVLRLAAAKKYQATIAAMDEEDRRRELEKSHRSSASSADKDAKMYERVIDTLAHEREVLGLNAREAEKLNQIRAAGVELGSAEAEAIAAKVDALYDEKDALAEVEKRQKAMKDLTDDLKTALVGVGVGLAQAFREGGDVGASVIDMLINKAGSLGDKLLGKGLDMLFDIGLNALTGAIGGGFSSSLGAGAGSVFTGSSPSIGGGSWSGMGSALMAAPRAMASQPVHVTVGVDADSSGNLLPFVSKVSGATVAQKGPDMVARYNRARYRRRRPTLATA